MNPHSEGSTGPARSPRAGHRLFLIDDADGIDVCHQFAIGGLVFNGNDRRCFPYDGCALHLQDLDVDARRLFLVEADDLLPRRT
jgi:hypothetical protein